jgi:hypothetical protein
VAVLRAVRHEPYVAVARFVARWLPADHPRQAELPRLRERGHQALAVMVQQLARQDSWFSCGYSVADIALIAYTHEAPVGGIALDEHIPRYRPGWRASIRPASCRNHLLSSPGTRVRRTEPPIPARQKNVNRARSATRTSSSSCALAGRAHKPRARTTGAAGQRASARDFLELFESQLISRHLDLMARVLRVQQKVFYTIGSSGTKATRWSRA